MQYTSDPTQMSKSQLQSELNGLWYIEKWTREDYAYRDKLLEEIAKRIESECIEAAG